MAAVEFSGGNDAVAISGNKYDGLPEELVSSAQCETLSLRRAGFLRHEDVEDFEQELVLHGWKILPRFVPTSGVPLGFFLTQAMRRRAFSLLRKRLTERRIPVEKIDSYEALREEFDESFVEGQASADPADSATLPHRDLVLALDLEKIFASLPPRHQAIVGLLRNESIAATARKLGLSRAVIYAALEEIREVLAKEGFTPPPSRTKAREKTPMHIEECTEQTPAQTSKPERMKTSYSMWSLFRNCRRAARLRYLDNIVPIERDPNLAFGSLIHDCLERWHRDRDLPAVLEHIDAAYTNRHASDHDHRDWHYARAMMTGYANTYPTEEFEVVALEEVFDAEIVNPKSNVSSRSFTISGKVDGIVKIGDQYFILEHKTAAHVGADYLERLWTDFQITLYAHYIEQTRGIRISGILYNILLKTRLQQSKGETQEEYEARYADLVAKSKSGKSSAKRRMPETDDEFAARLAEKYAEPEMFHREMLYLSRDRFKQLRAELWELTQAFLHARRHDAFYQNTSFCFQYGRPCPYFQLCRSSENPNVLENLYTKREPHEELRTDGSEPTEPAPVF